MYQKKHTMRWLRSILAVVILCLLLCSLLCLYLLRALEVNVMETNKSLNGYVQESIDSRLEELHRYSLTLEISGANIELKNRDRPFSSSYPSYTYQLADTMRDIVITNRLADSMYIYYPQIGLTVGSMGVYEAPAYYALQSGLRQQGYEAFQRQLTAEQNALFALLPVEDEERLCYMRQMRMSGDIRAVVVVEISQVELLQTFSQAEDAQTGLLLEGRLAALSSPSPQLLLAEALYEKNEEGKQRKEGDSFVFFNPSHMPGLVYVNIYSAKGILRPVSMALLICISGIIGCFVIGIAGSVYISQKNARPMEQIIHTLGTEQEKEDKAYQYIVNKVESMMAEKYKNEELLLENQVLLNGLFLTMVLRGDLSTENAIFNASTKYEVNLGHPFYQVMLLAGKDLLVPERQPMVTELQKKADETEWEVFLCMYNGQIVILLNVDEPVSPCQTEALLKDFMAAFYAGQEAGAAAGRCYDSLEDIVSSYHDALQALHSIQLSKSHPVRCCRAGQAFTDTGDSGLLKNFVHLVYARQYGKARQMVPRLYDEYIYSGIGADVEIMRQNAVNNLLRDALLAALPACQVQNEIRSLSLQASPKAQKLMTDQVLSLLMKASVNEEAGERMPVAVRARKIIDEDFTDPMIGLYMISEQLNVSNSYLSTAFKNEYEISVIQYINRLRIEKAKELILNTDMKMKEIAGAVGFSSDINFIRVFKKLENQTPSTLRHHSDIENSSI